MSRATWRELAIEAQRLAQDGHLIPAIKLLRQTTGCGLKEAHDAAHDLKALRVIEQ
jgi:ribosomal protein L7/L12